jgi:hypothetical protein
VNCFEIGWGKQKSAFVVFRFKGNKGQEPKSRQANSPTKKGRPEGGKGTTKNQTLHLLKT